MIREAIDDFFSALKKSAWIVSLVTIVGTAYYTYHKMSELDALEHRVNDLVDKVHNKDKQCQDMEHAVQIATIESRINYCKGAK